MKERDYRPPFSPARLLEAFEVLRAKETIFPSHVKLLLLSQSDFSLPGQMEAGPCQLRPSGAPGAGYQAGALLL